MKAPNKLLGAVFFVFCFLSSIIFTPQNSLAEDALALKWGLEKPDFYSEMEATMRQDAARWPPKEKEDNIYRYFTIKENQSRYWRLAERLSARHHSLWDSYSESVQSTTQDGYLRYVEHNDPYFSGSIKEMAPVLYFDFIGVGGKEHVLESIEVRTVSFSEYSGGGFIDKEAWYDIVLSHNLGTKLHKVERKLRFKGSGRTELRFWSDNYYPSVGLAPMGCFAIEITFHFLVEGKAKHISTGVFKIDV
jgi:hypothetical protein